VQSALSLCRCQGPASKPDRPPTRIYEISSRELIVKANYLQNKWIRDIPELPELASINAGLKDSGKVQSFSHSLDGRNRKRGDAPGRPSWQSSLLAKLEDPSAKFFCGNRARGKKKKMAGGVFRPVPPFRFVESSGQE
jgi:hypothetical protein